MMPRTMRRFLFGTLRGRLILGVAAVHAVMMALFISDLTMRHRAMLLDRQIEEATALSHALATSSAEWIAADDISGLQELVEAQRRYPELVFAILADKQGRVLADTDKSRRGLFMFDLPREARQTVFSKTPALVDVAAPAMIQGRHVGWIRVGIGQKAAGEKLAAITRSGILYALAAIVTGSIIAWMLGRRITRRLYAVQETINRVRAGDRLARSSITGGDEAAMMAHEFNSMLDAVAERDAELRRRDAEYKESQRVAQIGSWDWDATTDTILWSDEYYRIYDIDPKLPTPNYLEHLKAYTPESGERLDAAVKKTMETREPYKVDLELAHPTARTRWIAARGETRCDANGRIVGLRGTAQNITEQKGAEDKILALNLDLEDRVRRRTAELEVANRELEAFSYSVSHDLRAPLRAIDGFSRIFLDEHADKLPPEARRYLDLVRSNTVQMGRLIEDLLNLSRIGRQVLSTKEVQVEVLVREALEVLRGEREGRRVEIAIGDLPPCEGDPSLLRQVFLNLLSNALKFTRRREIARIEIGGRREEGENVYFVRDNGVGFDMRYAGKLFVAFQRLHKAEEYEGTGVGLAIVQRIVHRHGGRVWAEAETDKGATFYMALPGRGKTE